ncbi:hypothetical protein N7466_005471 [Penicillium verhagenii]|uniref:uncharacterized protein n=1 Tax=Penicillium verhagenii TaxID=1562060 RepID=UPI0025456D21|nr:uncharacterized protein N7466_005471 [Penicillium verhagenii]KAJ5929978.1 hypothetical protein N7466_005471 [Penicillium verhagenii]
MANTNCSRSYHEAIHTLRKSLDVNGGGVRFDMIPTVMCLTLAELMIPDSTTAMAEHIKAVGLLFQVYGPGACQDGFLHKLFVGFRPLLTFQAILHRRPIFLSSPAWIETPFSTFDPSVMQQLLNEAVVLPSLLHQADSLHQNPDLKIEFSCIDKTLQSFLELTSRLENWEIMLYVDGSPPYWPYRSAKDTVIPLPLWYPNITMANVFTNLWALQIVCMTEIKRFETRISQNSKSDQGLGEIDTLILALARQIYSSMDYLLQDEMELFGPASAFFPLRVAFQTFEVDQSGYKEDIACIETIVKRLHRKGLLSARAFVFDE